MDKRLEDGSTERDHLEAAAAKGSVKAEKELEGPTYPEVLEYLWVWARELVGRSGVGMDGASPLSYTTVRDWAALTGRNPKVNEVDALMLLDAVIRHPDAGEKPKDEPTTQTEAWPTRKADG